MAKNAPSNELQGLSERKQMIKSFSQEFIWKPTLKIVSPKAHSPKIIRKKLIDTPLPPIPIPVRKKQTLEAPFIDRKEYNYHTKIVKDDYGDKPYKKPEQSSGFFLLDGLVSGVDYKTPISFRFLKNLPNKYNGAGIYTSLMKTLSKEKLNKP
ncbi:unnamed protein product [Blepharisma stoltei]|uniref:Uncharacterized protein n=1 Tax=Blepharisma stoltei TaxID=1481888 RepID=A0AAU9K779_9CILI|nr:unnamed protein product [Blepharisma stoltei]